MNKEYIALTFIVSAEGKYFVSESAELGTSSFGETEEEAIKNLKEATSVYLDTLVEMGASQKTLEEKQVRVYDYMPSYLHVSRAKYPIGSTVKPIIMPLPSPPKEDAEEVKHGR